LLGVCSGWQDYPKDLRLPVNFSSSQMEHVHVVVGSRNYHLLNPYGDMKHTCNISLLDKSVHVSVKLFPNAYLYNDVWATQFARLGKDKNKTLDTLLGAVLIDADGKDTLDSKNMVALMAIVLRLTNVAKNSSGQMVSGVANLHLSDLQLYDKCSGSHPFCPVFPEKKACELLQQALGKVKGALLTKLFETAPTRSGSRLGCPLVRKEIKLLSHTFGTKAFVTDEQEECKDPSTPGRPGRFVCLGCLLCHL